MKILAFGEVMLRLMVPDHKTLLQTDELRSLFCGTGVNILAQLNKFGYETTLATKLPDNNIGKTAAACLSKLGIDDQNIVYGSDTIGCYFLEMGYGNRPSRVTYMNRINSSFCKSIEADYDFGKMLIDIGAVHICGIVLALSESVKKIAISLAKEANKKNIPVFFDFNYRPSLWKDKDYDHAKKEYEEMLRYSDVVFAGVKDAKLILGLDTDNESVKEIMKIVANKYNIKVVACTSRDYVDEVQYLKGHIYSNNEYAVTKSHQLLVLDRIGAGDGYTAGVIDGVLQNKPIQETVDFAISTAVLAHTIYGDIPLVELEDINNHLSGNKLDLIR